MRFLSRRKVPRRVYTKQGVGNKGYMYMYRISKQGLSYCKYQHELAVKQATMERRRQLDADRKAKEEIMLLVMAEIQQNQNLLAQQVLLKKRQASPPESVGPTWELHFFKMLELKRKIREKNQLIKALTTSLEEVMAKYLNGNMPAEMRQKIRDIADEASKELS
jgi:hypothetical protein